jgi:GT2 family glycosyltransferase/glycosyltransferase involved in cell wall biosynthesis
MRESPPAEPQPEADEARILAEACRVTDDDLEAIRRAHAASVGPREVRTINWFIPQFDHPFFAGINTILRFADHYAATLDVESRFVAIGAGSPDRLRSLIGSAFPRLSDADVLVAGAGREVEEVPQADATIATFWPTAYAVARTRYPGRRFYFVQDFEPMFYAGGTVYALAEETYRMGYFGIASSPTLQRMYESYGGQSTGFVYCIDPSVIYPRSGPRDPADSATVFFYGRPSNPRNCYELGMAALRALKRPSGSDVRIVTAGAVPPADREGWIEYLGVLDHREIGELYRRCDIGLVLSASLNPSFVSFELMASGVAQVVNRHPGFDWVFRDGENCLAAQATADGLAAALDELVANEGLRARLAAQAQADIRRRHSDWAGEMDRVYRFLRDPEGDAPEGPEARLTELAGSVAVKEVALAERETVVRELRRRERELESQVKHLDRTLRRVTTGSTYRLLQRLIASLNRLAPWGTRRRSFFMAPMRGVRMILSDGFLAFLRHLLAVWVWVPRLWERAIPPAQRLTPDERYELWLNLHVLPRSRLRQMRREQRALTYLPTISLVMPTFNSRPEWIRDAVRSVRRQIYPHWELCVADDGSTLEGTRRALRRWERRESRLKVVYREQNGGVAVASNDALALATGEFVGLLDHDDELKPHALLEVAKALNEDRSLDFVYSDEDKKDPSGRLVEPFFKPDWSPDLLMSANYVTHLSVYRKDVLAKVGGFRQGYDGSQDYDLTLRVSEVTDRIEHVASPLYTWRQVPGSAAGSIKAKPFAYDAARRALQDALTRRGHRGEVGEGHSWGYYRARYAIEGRPRVVLIIPTRDRIDLLRRCVESIRARTSYANHQILVVDNESALPETKDYLTGFGGRVIRQAGEFNLSALFNAAAEIVDADVFVFLHNDVEVMEDGWIEAMLEHAQRENVAAVGARLLFPDGRPQHEGVVVGANQGLAKPVAGHGYFGLEECVRNTSAVSAACLMTRSEVFRKLGGFDEDLATAYGDVDYCLRALDKGWRVVYTPWAVLAHEQARSLARAGPWRIDADARTFRERWPGYRDPYYNANLSLEDLYDLELDFT